MKKLLVLVAVFTTLALTNASAQNGPGGGDPAAMLQRYKDRVKPQLMEKAKISDAEADKVIAISWSYRGRMREVAKLAEEEKKKQTDELKAAEQKEYTAIPLTETQIKAVNEFFEEQRKEMEKRRQQNGNNGN